MNNQKTKLAEDIFEDQRLEMLQQELKDLSPKTKKWHSVVFLTFVIGLYALFLFKPEHIEAWRTAFFILIVGCIQQFMKTDEIIHKRIDILAELFDKKNHKNS